MREVIVPPLQNNKMTIYERFESILKEAEQRGYERGRAEVQTTKEADQLKKDERSYMMGLLLDKMNEVMEQLNEEDADQKKAIPENIKE
jgi:hypothetical protein